MSTRSTGGFAWEIKLRRVRELAMQDKATVFNNLGHIIDAEMLYYCYYQLDGKKAVGIDGVTKIGYFAEVTKNIEELLTRIRRGTYEPKPARMTEIPKEDGSKRPLAIACFEDKIVQSALNLILQAIFEPTFLPCSFGFRPGTGCHEALIDLFKHMSDTPKGAIVEIDIRKYFNRVPHAPLKGFLDARISDKRFMGLIDKMLTAPIQNLDGSIAPSHLGVPQGSILSPLLANIYLHHVIDLWVKDLKGYFKGSINVVRFADDMVFVMSEPHEASALYRTLPKRLGKFGLEMATEKSSIVPCGTWTIRDMREKRSPMPTFKFLGFEVHWALLCKLDKRGRKQYRPMVRPRKDRMNSRLKDVKVFLRKNLNAKNHMKILKQVRAVVRGWINYFAVSDCAPHLWNFSKKARRLIHHWFNRRGKKGCMSWPKLQKVLDSIEFEKYSPIKSLFSGSRKQAVPG